MPATPARTRWGCPVLYCRIPCSDCRFRKAVAHASGEDGLAIVATSVAGLREVAGNLRNSGIANLIWLCKGFEENTGLMPSQVVSEVTANRLNTGVLSGPSFAQEVAAGLPCALTIASKSSALRQRVTDAINGGNMRIYSSDDVTGVEVGGAVKNILAIATGMSDGLALGMNARAALITRGLAEITRLGVALGGRLETFMGLTGMGDLILTCTGDFVTQSARSVWGWPKASRWKPLLPNWAMSPRESGVRKRSGFCRPESGLKCRSRMR